MEVGRPAVPPNASPTAMLEPAAMVIGDATRLVRLVRLLPVLAAVHRNSPDPALSLVPGKTRNLFRLHIFVGLAQSVLTLPSGVLFQGISVPKMLSVKTSPVDPAISWHMSTVI